jgi:hypothetical protein
MILVVKCEFERFGAIKWEIHCEIPFSSLFISLKESISDIFKTKTEKCVGG